jgi:hypothetical protein
VLFSVNFQSCTIVAMSPTSGQAIQFERFQGDLYDSDKATAETVACMCRYIQEAQNDPEVFRAAQEAMAWGNPVDGAFWWAKHHIRFVQDHELISRLLNERDQLEMLVTPAVMVRSSQPQGDCDDFTMMVCALLKCMGLDFEIVTVAADPYDQSQFSHVYCRAVLPDESRIPLDASHGRQPGWCVPPSRTFRLQVWDESGRPVQDQVARRFNGLHGYVAGRGLSGFRGMGQDDGDNSGDDSTGSSETLNYPGVTSPLTGPSACPANTVLQGNLCVPIVTSGGVTYCTSTNQSDCPAGSVFLQGSTLPSALSATPTATNWAQLFSQLLGTAGNVATAAVQPTVPVGTVNVPVSNLLLWGGAALVGIVVLAAVLKK